MIVLVIYRNMMNTSMYNRAEILDRQGAWREIKPPKLDDITALRMENEALRTELATLNATSIATTHTGKL